MHPKAPLFKMLASIVLLISISSQNIVLAREFQEREKSSGNPIDSGEEVSFWTSAHRGSGLKPTIQQVDPTPTPTEIPPTETPEAPLPFAAPSTADEAMESPSPRTDATTYYVDISTGSNSNSCTSSATPCKNIQETINKAAAGDIIHVASGTYMFSTNGTPNVVIINKSITLSGGWDPGFSSQTGASTIDGEMVNNGILVITGTAVVENFIIQNSKSTNSGAIYMVNGNLTLNRSTLRNNFAGNGAGIFLDNGSLTILNSTISNNSAAGYGGGIYASLNSSASVTIKNSTIVYNFATSGGGIRRANGTYNITNSIIANNSGGSSSPDCSGTIWTANYNIIENPSGCIITNHEGNLNVDPMVDSNPTTDLLIHALLDGSPAINGGDPDPATCLTEDQRGAARPQFGICDIGAFEYVNDTLPPTVWSITRKNTPTISYDTADFRVVFTRSVTGVDIDDFSLTTTGTITGATVSEVIESGGIVFTVRVNTGSGNGTIRLDVPDTASITDLSETPLDGLPFTSGEVYTVFKSPPRSVGIPRLSLPRRNAITNDTTPTFNWTNVLNAQGYEIVIATDSAFTQVVLTETVSSPAFTPSVPLGDGRYFWRVRALNSAAQPGRFSLGQAFTIDTTAPNVPALTSPMDAASLQLTPVFRWTRVAGAVLYEFQYDNDADFSSPTYSALLRINYRKPPAMPNGTHYWRVRARDAAGNWSGWSPAYSVTISQ